MFSQLWLWRHVCSLFEVSWHFGATYLLESSACTCFHTGFLLSLFIISEGGWGHVPLTTLTDYMQVCPRRHDSSSVPLSAQSERTPFVVYFTILYLCDACHMIKWIMNDKLKIIWKKEISCGIIFYSTIFLEGLRKPMKYLRIANIPAEIQTLHLPNTRLEHTARPTCLVPNQIWGLLSLLPTEYLESLL
jgi:hypothetical protein